MFKKEIKKIFSQDISKFNIDELNELKFIINTKIYENSKNKLNNSNIDIFSVMGQSRIV